MIKRRYGFRKVFVTIIVMGIIFFLGFMFFRIYAGIEIKDYSKENTNLVSQTIGEKENENKEVTEMLENATNCVVGVSKIQNIGNSIFSEGSISEFGIGSGVIVSENGYILTNEHVSGLKGSNCFVTIENGKEYSAVVVWSDSSLDLAIIKINLKCVNYAKLADSDNVKVGETTYAIGNPIGYEFKRTVTSGIISALDRTIKFKENDKEIYMSNLIQTDATINPGNSGGPLINLNGEVIGINSVKITSAEGIGFAVPINVVKPVIEKLDKNGNFEEPWIGIFAYDKNVIPYLNSSKDFDTGIYIAQISIDSPAYRSGLQVGDIIVQIDGNKLEKMCDLREYIYGKNIGDIVNIDVFRNNKTIKMDLKLSKK